MFDFIVVGAGAAGCVVAKNLVKNGFTVALVEAADDFNSNYYVQIPSLFGNLWGDVTYAPKDCAYSPPWNEWSFPSYSGDEPKIYDYVRGSNVGGSANHHAMVCFRGSPSVYDTWAELVQDPSWRYENVKYIFDDIQKTWLSISHTEPEEFELRFMQKTINEFNIPFTPQTSESQKGIGFWDFMIDSNGVRSSSSIALLPSIRKSKKCTFFLNCQVSRIIFKNNCAVGIEHYKGKHLYNADTLSDCQTNTSGPFVLRARHEVILCGGAINSPQVLLLSGIGDKEQLQGFDIPVVYNNPEVGRNMMDHPEMWNNYEIFNITHRWQVFFPFSMTSPDYINYKDWKVGPTRYPFSATGMNTALPDTSHELHIGIYTIPSNNFNTREWFFDYDYKNKTYASFLIEFANPDPNSRGVLTLRSGSPFDVPNINMKLNTDENATVIAQGVLLIRSIMKSLENNYSPVEVYPPGELDQKGLEEFFKSQSAYGHHICGTCSMGKVVDNKCRVYGVKRLRVVDASIFPTIVSANPCFPVYMVAEKISRDIVQKYTSCAPQRRNPFQR